VHIGADVSKILSENHRCAFTVIGHIYCGLAGKSTASGRDEIRY